jgi:hypothetical protein
VACTFFLLTCPQSAKAADQDWSLSLTPYGWLTGVSGTTGVQGIGVRVNKSFFDLLDDSDSAIGGFGRVEGHLDRFGVYADGGYAHRH